MPTPKGKKQVAITISEKVFDRLATQAAAKGLSRTAYACLLFEAAYAARCGQMRSEPPVDAELDDQVRLVFACAGQGSARAIAQAIGIPEERVEAILEGLRSQRGIF